MSDNSIRFDNPLDTENIELQVLDSVVDAEAVLTEGGDIDIELVEDVEFTPPEDYDSRMAGEEQGRQYTFEGNSESGHSVEARNAIITPKIEGLSRYMVHGLRASEIIFDSSGGDAIVNKEVTVEIDMMNFAPRPPFVGDLENLVLLERDDFEATMSLPEDIEERIDLIKESKRSLYTGTVRVTQEVNRDGILQIENALESLTDINELLSFLQGVYPSPIRGQIVSIDGHSPDFECKKWCPIYNDSIGHGFKGERIIWGGDASTFIEEAYDNYVTEKKEKYALNMVFSWYLDALLQNRSLDSRFASICCGIELLAKRHSDLGPQHSSTEDKIVHLVNELDVEVRDLAEFSDSYSDSKLDDDGYSNEYFYNKTRQYVMHGDNLPPDFDELYKDYLASLKLFQRLLRNQLVDSNSLGKYSNSMSNIEIKDKRYKDG